MSEKLHIYISVIFILISISYSFFKWFRKGKIFHPGFIYSFVNGLLFIVFALGQYDYLVKIHWLYYYVYALIITFFIVGIILGENFCIKKVKDLNINNKNFWLLYITLLTYFTYLFFNLRNFSLYGAVEERFSGIAISQMNFNIFDYIIYNVVDSFIEIMSPVVFTYAFYRKKYIPIIILSLLMLVINIFTNSRTALLYSMFLIIICFYTVYNNNKKLYFYYRNKLLFLVLRKNFLNFLKKIVVIIAIILALFVTLTYYRMTIHERYDYQKIEKNIEQYYRAEKKQSWLTVTSPFPPVNMTITQISLYLGGTVASGGVIARIATDTGLHTWGLRNFFVFHRILAQLKLDGGFSNIARDNLLKVQDAAVKEIPAVGPGWFGDPGNLILDFGYIGSLVASLFTGWLVGWLYGSLCRAGIFINAIATYVFATSMFLTPAVSIFGLYLSSSISFFALLLYLLTQKPALRYSFFEEYKTLKRK